MTQQCTESINEKTNTSPADKGVLIQPNDGIEMGRFRLREGVTEEAMRAAWAHMTSTYLSAQHGWRGQRLIRFEDGTFMDMAFAASPACAHSICDSWAGQAVCDAFLQLIDPESMEIGSVI